MKPRKYIILCSAFLIGMPMFFSGSNSLFSQKLPLGYISYYEQNAKTAAFLKTLVLPNPGYWEIQQGNYTLIKAIPDEISSDTVIPSNKGIIDILIVGEYHMEFEFRILDTPADSSDGFYFLGPMKNCNNYLAVAFNTDSVRIYHYNQGIQELVQKEKLAVDITQWSKVRVERDMLRRSLIFELKGNATQKFEVINKKLVMGYIGFGTQAVNSALRNIRIWAPTAIQDKTFRCE